MAGLLKKAKDYLTYKVPVNPENGFELFEGADDDKGKVKKADESTNFHGSESRITGSAEACDNKMPLTAAEWNRSKRQQSPCSPAATGNTIHCILKDNFDIFSKRFNAPKNQDIVLREFNIAKKYKALLVYIGKMTDQKVISRDILMPLMSKESFSEIGENDLITYVIENILSVGTIARDRNPDSITEKILCGDTALFVDGYDECIIIETKGFEKRAVEKPSTETVIRGSQEGFSENLDTNLTLVRRIIRSENLITETMLIGKVNKVKCAIMYMDNIVNPKLVEEVKKRIQGIDADYMAGGMIEEFLEDKPWTLLPRSISTERPDRTASFILDGQVAIITEGTPFVHAVPVTFFQLVHTSEDAALRWQYGTFLRFIRLFGILIAAFLPGAYLALILYHQEMVPTELLSSIARSKEEVPFPTILEILMMELAFELIREGGIRIPGVIGQTLGIIGALILGQAAVAAGLVSPILIIIVSLTGLGSFAIPNYSLSMAVRIIRFAFIFFGAIAGFYGISAAIVLTGGILCSMKSFGVPFFSPVAPRTKSNRDLIIRSPDRQQKMRPDYLNTQNRNKQGKDKKK